MAVREIGVPPFEPLHKAHAIEQVAFGINFEKSIDNDALKAVRDALGELKELPAKAELRSLSIGIGPSGPLPSPQLGSKVGGYSFKRIAPDGTEEAELQLQRNSIAFRTTRYTRWDDVWNQAKVYFNAMLPIYCDKVRIFQLSLNYVDKFVCEADLNDVRVADILQGNSPYLAPRVLLINDLWHSHSGTFSKVNASTKRLINVNVDFITEAMGEKSRATLGITSILTNMFNQPGYEAFEVSAQDAGGIVERQFHELHDLDKEVLSSIISANMAKRIALGP